MADEQYDVLVIGSSLGGVAAALRAASMGASVCLIDPGAWVGGQFTAQGVSKPDENKYIETVGSTAAYREFRHTVRAWYRANARLSAVGSSQPLFNPGGAYNPAQPQFAVEPKLGDTILKQMIQGTPKLAWRPNTTVAQFELAGDAIAAVNTRAADGSETRYVAKYVLDATDLGDCLPHVLRDGEWVLGAEAHADTGEAGAPANPEPTWIQPVTVICAIEHRPRGENHTIPEPPNYARHRDEQKYSLKDGAITSMFGGGTTMFNYRQYLDARNFNDPNFRYDRTTLNAGANDYGVKSIPTGDPAEDLRIIQEARDASLGFLYWLQTECPRDDHSGTGYPELRPVTEAFGTADGMAPVAYIRESRRIKALKTIVRSEVEQSSANRGPRAQLFDDSCGVGTYAFMDGHALPGEGMSGFWIDIWPAQISTRALIPERVTNLLAACKNLGTTHFTSGLYRLHPFEWNIGESAGALAAFCLSQGTTPHAVAADAHLMRAYQRALLAEGVPLFWWTDVLPGDPLWTAVQMAGATKVMTGDGNREMRFNPDNPVTDDARSAITARVGADVPADVDTRGHLAQWLFEAGYT
jgi:FAD-dependent oxidoreductase family protein